MMQRALELGYALEFTQTRNGEIKKIKFLLKFWKNIENFEKKFFWKKW